MNTVTTSNVEFVVVNNAPTEVHEVAPDTTYTTGTVVTRFDLETTPLNVVKVIAGKFMATITLPLADLDIALANTDCSELITQRFRDIYRTLGQYHDENGLPTEQFKAGRQSISRKLEIAHELLSQEGTLHVATNLHPANAKAIEVAMLKWRSGSPITRPTASPKAVLGFDRPDYDNPDMEVKAVWVKRFFANGQGFINAANSLSPALYDTLADMLYFEDYVSSATRTLDGVEKVDDLNKPIYKSIKDSKGKVVRKELVGYETKLVSITKPAFEIVREIENLGIHRDGTFHYKAHKWPELVMPVEAKDFDYMLYGNHHLTMVALRYCVLSWRQVKAESAAANMNPSRRQYNLVEPVEVAPDGSIKRNRIKFGHDQLGMAEAQAGFDDLWEQRLADIAEENRLERMTLKAGDVGSFDSHQHEDEYIEFAKLVNETDDMQLHARKIQPILHYNARRPGPWSVTPKDARFPLGKMAVDKGILAYYRREQQLELEAASKPRGDLSVRTHYDKAAHDGTAYTVYIGQSWERQEGNPLGNGPLGNATEYRKWLWDCIQHNTAAGQEVRKFADHIKTGSWMRIVAWPIAKKGQDKRFMPPPAWAQVVADAVRYLADKK